MAAAAAAAPEQKRKPGWMSMPGGPREPDFKVFQAKLTSLVAEKKKCFEDLKAIREEFDAARGETGDRSKIDGERSQLRDRISKIDADRRKERDNRKEADRRIDEVRKERLSIQRQLEALADEVGAFESVAEIDMAIDVVEFKMATGAGSLKAEKECIKRINKLQEAKDLLLQLEPLEEAIADSQERELDLRQESRDIHARIQALNDDYMKNLQLKIEKDNERKANTFDFSALHERRSKVSKKIDDLNKQIDDLRADFDKSREAWNEWRVVAKERFEAQIKAEREERDRARKEADAARKLARRRERAQHKMNPHKVEIEICGTLIGYLEQKVRIHNREQEEAEKRKKLAAFDPSAAAPKGAVVKGGNDDDWLFGDRTGKKAAKPAPKKAEGEKTAKPAATEVAKDAKKKQVHHSQDKLAQFEKVKVEAPLTFGAIEAAVDTLKKQKKEYESKIVVNVDDVELSESDNEGEAAGEAADDATQVASTAAPTAA